MSRCAVCVRNGRAHCAQCRAHVQLTAPPGWCSFCRRSHAGGGHCLDGRGAGAAPAAAPVEITPEAARVALEVLAAWDRYTPVCEVVRELRERCAS